LWRRKTKNKIEKEEEEETKNCGRGGKIKFWRRKQ